MLDQWHCWERLHCARIEELEVIALVVKFAAEMFDGGICIHYSVSKCQSLQPEFDK